MILAFTGAGISEASGIPTFQQQPEIREKLMRTFANDHPEKYREVMREWTSKMRNILPNDAHYALAEYDIPVITMNVDGLHQRAKNSCENSSQIILPIHGRLPTEEELPYCDELAEAPVLYGDTAPNYSKAYCMVEKLQLGDTFLIIGVSDYTNISTQLRIIALEQHASIVEINDNAVDKVREFLRQREDDALSYFSGR